MCSCLVLAKDATIPARHALTTPLAGQLVNAPSNLVIVWYAAALPAPAKLWLRTDPCQQDFAVGLEIAAHLP